jgi:FAD synthetase
MTKVMGFGTFDGLHPGHLFFLEELKKHGNQSIVVIARDSNVQKIKGRAPLKNENERLTAIQDTEIVDHAELGNEQDFYKCIRDHQPDRIALGYDQKADVEKITGLFPELEIVRLGALKPEKYKSSLINNVVTL